MGCACYGQGRACYGQGRACYGQGRACYGQGRACYGQGRACYGQGRAVEAIKTFKSRLKGSNRLNRISRFGPRSLNQSPSPNWRSCGI
jgi:hypothetical protein